MGFYVEIQKYEETSQVDTGALTTINLRVLVQIATDMLERHMAESCNAQCIRVASYQNESTSIAPTSILLLRLLETDRYRL